MNKILFFNNIINWLIQWRNLIQFLMEESVFITTIVYALYFILLGIFGIWVGFLLGIYRRKGEIDQIYLFFLLLLLHIFSQKEFDDTLLRDLSDSYRAANIAEPFEKFSFEPLPQIESRSFKLILKETEQIPQIPFPMSDDSFIDVDFMIETMEEPRNYQFQLFQF